MDLEIRGAEDLAKLSKALKQLKDKELKRELTRGITRATKPLKAAVRAHALAKLPKRGGLGVRVAKSRLAHRTRSGRNASVRIEAKPSFQTLRDPLRADRGRIKHPVFGMAHSSNAWVLQDVTPGWFSKPLEEGAPVVRAELEEVMDDLAKKVLKKF